MISSKSWIFVIHASAFCIISQLGYKSNIMHSLIRAYSGFVDHLWKAVIDRAKFSLWLQHVNKGLVQAAIFKRASFLKRKIQIWKIQIINKITTKNNNVNLNNNSLSVISIYVCIYMYFCHNNDELFKCLSYVNKPLTYLLTYLLTWKSF